jgi:hypothetical protein
LRNTTLEGTNTFTFGVLVLVVGRFCEIYWATGFFWKLTYGRD